MTVLTHVKKNLVPDRPRLLPNFGLGSGREIYNYLQKIDNFTVENTLIWKEYLSLPWDLLLVTENDGLTGNWDLSISMGNDLSSGKNLIL